MSDAEVATPSEEVPTPTIQQAVAPRCGRHARGHDPNPIQVLKIDVWRADDALPIDELRVDAGTRLVVVCGDRTQVLYSHTPGRVLSEWVRCRRAGIVATWNPSSFLLGFPSGPGSRAIVSVSEEPVHCDLADRADFEALTRPDHSSDRSFDRAAARGAAPEGQPPSGARVVRGVALPPPGTGCPTTDPGHAANLTGVKLALAAVRERPAAGVAVRVRDVVGSTVTLERVDALGTAQDDDRRGPLLRVRCHATELLAVARTDRAVGTLVEEQHLLLLPARPDEGGTSYLTDDGAIRAVNVALEGQPFAPCALAARLDEEEVV